MSGTGNFRIEIEGVLEKGTGAKLQKELDALGKKLELQIPIDHKFMSAEIGKVAADMRKQFANALPNSMNIGKGIENSLDSIGDKADETTAALSRTKAAAESLDNGVSAKPKKKTPEQRAADRLNKVTQENYERATSHLVAPSPTTSSATKETIQQKRLRMFEEKHVKEIEAIRQSGGVIEDENLAKVQKNWERHRKNAEASVPSVVSTAKPLSYSMPNLSKADYDAMDAVVSGRVLLSRMSHVADSKSKDYDFDTFEQNTRMHPSMHYFHGVALPSEELVLDELRHKSLRRAADGVNFAQDFERRNNVVDGVGYTLEDIEQLKISDSEEDRNRARYVEDTLVARQGEIKTLRKDMIPVVDEKGRVRMDMPEELKAQGIKPQYEILLESRQDAMTSQGVDMGHRLDSTLRAVDTSIALGEAKDKLAKAKKTISDSVEGFHKWSDEAQEDFIIGRYDPKDYKHLGDTTSLTKAVNTVKQLQYGVLSESRQESFDKANATIKELEALKDSKDNKDLPKLTLEQENQLAEAYRKRNSYASIEQLEEINTQAVKKAGLDNIAMVAADDNMVAYLNSDVDAGRGQQKVRRKLSASRMKMKTVSAEEESKEKKKDAPEDRTIKGFHRYNNLTKEIKKKRAELEDMKARHATELAEEEERVKKPLYRNPNSQLKVKLTPKRKKEIIEQKRIEQQNEQDALQHEIDTLEARREKARDNDERSPEQKRADEIAEQRKQKALDTYRKNMENGRDASVLNAERIKIQDELDDFDKGVKAAEDSGASQEVVDALKKKRLEVQRLLDDINDEIDLFGKGATLSQIEADKAKTKKADARDVSPTKISGTYETKEAQDAVLGAKSQTQRIRDLIAETSRTSFGSRQEFEDFRNYARNAILSDFVTTGEDGKTRVGGVLDDFYTSAGSDINAQNTIRGMRSEARELIQQLENYWDGINRDLDEREKRAKEAEGKSADNSKKPSYAMSKDNTDHTYSPDYDLSKVDETRRKELINARKQGLIGDTIGGSKSLLSDLTDIANKGLLSDDIRDKTKAAQEFNNKMSVVRNTLASLKGYIPDDEFEKLEKSFNNIVEDKRVVGAFEDVRKHLGDSLDSAEALSREGSDFISSDDMATKIDGAKRFYSNIEDAKQALAAMKGYLPDDEYRKLEERIFGQRDKNGRLIVEDGKIKQSGLIYDENVRAAKAQVRGFLSDDSGRKEEERQRALDIYRSNMANGRNHLVLNEEKRKLSDELADIDKQIEMASKEGAGDEAIATLKEKRAEVQKFLNSIDKEMSMFVKGANYDFEERHALPDKNFYEKDDEFAKLHQQRSYLEKDVKNIDKEIGKAKERIEKGKAKADDQSKIDSLTKEREEKEARIADLNKEMDGILRSRGVSDFYTRANAETGKFPYEENDDRVESIKKQTKRHEKFLAETAELRAYMDDDGEFYRIDSGYNAMVPPRKYTHGDYIDFDDDERDWSQHDGERSDFDERFDTHRSSSEDEDADFHRDVYDGMDESDRKASPTPSRKLTDEELLDDLRAQRDAVGKLIGSNTLSMSEGTEAMAKFRRLGEQIGDGIVDYYNQTPQGRITDPNEQYAQRTIYADNKQDALSQALADGYHPRIDTSSFNEADKKAKQERKEAIDARKASEAVAKDFEKNNPLIAAEKALQAAQTRAERARLNPDAVEFGDSSRNLSKARKNLIREQLKFLTDEDEARVREEYSDEKSRKKLRLHIAQQNIEALRSGERTEEVDRLLAPLEQAEKEKREASNAFWSAKEKMESHGSDAQDEEDRRNRFNELVSNNAVLKRAQETHNDAALRLKEEQSKFSDGEESRLRWALLDARLSKDKETASEREERLKTASELEERLSPLNDAIAAEGKARHELEKAEELARKDALETMSKEAQERIAQNPVVKAAEEAERQAMLRVQEETSKLGGEEAMSVHSAYRDLQSDLAEKKEAERVAKDKSAQTNRDLDEVRAYNREAKSWWESRDDEGRITPADSIDSKTSELDSDLDMDGVNQRIAELEQSIGIFRNAVDKKRAELESATDSFEKKQIQKELDEYEKRLASDEQERDKYQAIKDSISVHSSDELGYDGAQQSLHDYIRNYAKASGLSDEEADAFVRDWAAIDKFDAEYKVDPDTAKENLRKHLSEIGLSGDEIEKVVIEFEVNAKEAKEEINEVNRLAEQAGQTVGDVVDGADGSGKDKPKDKPSGTEKPKDEPKEYRKEVNDLIAKQERINNIKWEMTDSNISAERYSELRAKLHQLETEFHDAKSAANLTEDEIKAVNNAFAASQAPVKQTTDSFNRFLQVVKNIQKINVKDLKLDTDIVDVEDIAKAGSYLDSLEKEYDELRNSLKGQLSGDQLSKVVKELDTAKAKITEAKTALASKIDKNFSLKGYDAIYQPAVANAKKLKDSNTDLAQSYDKLIKEASYFTTVMNSKDSTVDDKIAAERRLKDAITETNNAYKAANAIVKANNSAAVIDKSVNAMERLSSETKIFSMKIDNWLKNNSAAMADYGSEIEDLKRRLKECNNAADFSRIKNEFKELTLRAQAAGKATMTFGDRLKMQAKRYAAYFSIAELSMEAVQGLRYMYQAVLEVDSAMVGLYRVTDLTSQQYDKLYDNMIASAKEYGQTLTDTINATTDWVKAGFDDTSEALGLAELTSVYQHISDLDYDTATENLLTAYKGFESQLTSGEEISFGKSFDEGDSLSAVSHITDVLNELDNQFAVTSAGIGEALQRSASSMNVAGNTMEQTAALVSAAMEVTQDPEGAGSTMKILSMRLRGMKGELQELGEETDENVENISKMQGQVLNLTHGKVNIFDDNGDFKSTYDIMKGIADVWEDLSTIEQADLIETIAGKHRANTVSALIGNFGHAEEMLEVALNSTGSAAKENEKYINSLQGRVDVMTASFQAFSNTVMSSDFLKGGISAITGFLNVLNKLIDTLGMLPTIAMVASGALAFKGIGAVKLNENKDGLSIFGQSPRGLLDVAGGIKAEGLNSRFFEKANESWSELNEKIAKSETSLANFVQRSRELDGNFDAAFKETMLDADADAQRFANSDTFHSQILQGDEQSSQAISNYTKEMRLNKVAADAQNKSLSDVAMIFADYNSGLEDANDTTKKNNGICQASGLHYTELADVVGEYNKEAGNVMKNAGSSGAAIGKYGASIAGATAKTVGLTAASVVADAAMGMFAGIIISVVVSALVKWINAEEDLAKKVEETTASYKNQHSELIKNKSNFEDLAKSYEKLSKGVDKFTGANKSLTADEYKEYQSVVNQIAETVPSLVAGYDSQGNAILNCASNVATLTKAYEDLIVAENNTLLNGDGEDYKGISDISKDLDNAYTKMRSAGVFGDKTTITASDGLDDMLKDPDITSEDFGKYTSVTIDQMYDALKRSFDSRGIELEGVMMPKVFASVEDKKKYIAEACKQHGDIAKEIVNGVNSNLDTEVQPMREAMNAFVENAFIRGDYSNIDTEMQSVVNSIVGGMDSRFIAELNKSGGEDAVIGYISNMMNTVNNLTAAQMKTLKDSFDLSSVFESGEITYGEYKAQLEATMKSIESMGFDEDVVSQIRLSLNVDEVNEQYDQLMTRLTSTDANEVVNVIGLDTKEADKFLSSLSQAELDIAMRVIPNLDRGATVAQIEDAISREMLIEGIGLDFNIAEETQWAAETLDTVLEELGSATGLTAESIGALTDRYKGLDEFDPSKLFAKTTQGVRLNTDAVNELEAALKKKNNEELDQRITDLQEEYSRLTDEINNASSASERANLYNQRDAIVDQINDVSLLKSQYEGLTSAYNDWVKAQEATDKGDMHDQAMTLMTDAEALKEAGRVGTNEFKASAQFVTNDDLSAADIGTIVDAWVEGKKKFDKYFTEDESGATAFLNDLEAAGQGWATLDESTGEWDLNVNIEDAAKHFGVSVDFIMTMLDELESRGIKINYDEEGFEQFKTHAEEAQEAYNKLLGENGEQKIEFEFGTGDINKVNEQLDEAMLLYDTITTADGEVPINAEGVEQVRTMLLALLEEKQKLEAPAVMSVEVKGDSATTEIGKATTLVQQLQKNLWKLDQAEYDPNINVENVQKNIQTIATSLGELEKSDPKIYAKLGLDETQIEAFKTAISNIQASVEAGVEPDPADLATVQSTIKGLDATVIAKVLTGDTSGATETVAVTPEPTTTDLGDGFFGTASITPEAKFTDFGNIFTGEAKIKPYLTQTHFRVTVSKETEADGTAHASGSTSGISSGRAFAQGNWGINGSGVALGGELGQELVRI